jgi:hypothetical protein
MSNLPTVLMSLGYRQPDVTQDPNRWAKTFGYAIFIVFCKEKRIGSYFYSTTGVFSCWKSEELKDPKNYLSDIAAFEQYADTPCCLPSKKISFLTAAQRAESLIGTDELT